MDEAAFHRNDGGESIGWLLQQTVAEFPNCLRIIATSSCNASLQGLKILRTIQIDDIEMDERVQRDARIFADYQFTVNLTVSTFFKITLKHFS